MYLPTYICMYLITVLDVRTHRDMLLFFFPFKVVVLCN